MPTLNHYVTVETRHHSDPEGTRASVRNREDRLIHLNDWGIRGYSHVSTVVLTDAEGSTIVDTLVRTDTH